MDSLPNLSNFPVEMILQEYLARFYKFLQDKVLFVDFVEWDLAIILHTYSCNFCKILQDSCKILQSARKRIFSCKNAQVLQDCFYWVSSVQYYTTPSSSPDIRSVNGLLV